MRTYYVHFGDPHCGLRHGLIAPGTELEYSNGEKREVLLSGWSEFIWNDVWLPGIEKVSEIAGDDAVVLICAGDTCHGSRFVEYLYTPFVDHQVMIAKQGFEPWRKVKGLASVYLAYGTGSHDYGENASTKMLREALVPWGYNVEIGDQLLLKDGGLRMDVAHHGPYVSSLPHLRSNGARRYAELHCRQELERGRTPPSWMMRGHVHRDVIATAEFWFGNEYQKCLITINPPMCGPNGYARKAARSEPYTRCGFWLVAVEDGEVVEVIPHIVERDNRRLVSIEIEPVYKKKKKSKKKKKR